MSDSFWEEYAQNEYDKMLARAPEHAQSMDKARSGAGRYGRVYIKQTRLRQSTLRIYVMWQSSRENGVKLEVFRDPGVGNVSGEWTGFDVDVGGIFLVSVHYFHIGIDSTPRKQMHRNAPPHSKSMTVKSPRMALPTTPHTQRNSQEIVSC